MSKILGTSALLGAGLGAAAAAWQLASLDWGTLGSDQLGWFWGSFALAGAVLTSLVAAVISHGRPKRGAAGIVGAAIVTALAAVILVPLNGRPLPNVFLVVTDTTRADHLSLYGYERDTTPFLEELAGQSVVFEQGYSQGSHTIVSTPSLLASCYPSEHGLNDYSDVLSEDHVLMSEALKEAGYYCFGVVTNPHLSERNGFDQGYDTYELFGKGNAASVFADSVNTRILYKLDFHLPAWRNADAERKDRPIFGFFFYTDPHGPYESPLPFPRRYLPEGSSREDWLFAWDPDWVQERGAPWVAKLVAQYDASIHYWDHAFRSFVGQLEERGHWKNSVLIYTSDHGEEFMEHGKYGHGHALWQEVVHVPLMVSWPTPVRFPPLPRTSRRIETLASGVDVLPSLLDFLRLPVPSGAHGHSFVRPSLGLSDDHEVRRVFFEEVLETYQRYDLRGVREGDWKYIVDHATEDGAIRQHLYDLASDPGEVNSLAAAEEHELDYLQDLVVEHTQRMLESAANPGSMTPDADHLERLRALGYAQ